ncbi:hypothetical protein B7939_01220 [Eggerthia catenaformis]|nr:hypothetical protein B7939_01220 [Eggerthia catenaformis]
MDLKEFVALRTGLEEEKANMYVELATQKVLEYTHRTKVLDVFKATIVDLACAMYEREGTHGEKSHSEGGISITWESANHSEILRALDSWRLAKAGGKIHEKGD